MSISARPAYDAVVAGYLGVDLAPGFSPAGASSHTSAGELLRPGRLVEVRGLKLSLGGAVANTGLAMRRFGLHVALVGKVGCDALGDQAAAILRAHDADAGLRRDARGRTAYGIVIAPPGTDRIFLEDPGCNATFAAGDIDYRLVARSRLFHFGYPTLMKAMYSGGGAELCRMLRRVRRLGVTTSLDVTLPDLGGPAGRVDWGKVLAAALPEVDVFMPSIEELLAMLEPGEHARVVRRARGGDPVDHVPERTFRRLGERVLGMGVKVLAIKAAHRGAYLCTGEVRLLRLALPEPGWSRREEWAEPVPVERRRMRNSCGAGDAAVAGFLSAMLSGETLERAGRLAMIAGRDSLYAEDALGGLRDWAAMRRDLSRPAAAARQNR